MQKVKKKSEDIYSKGGIVILVDKLCSTTEPFREGQESKQTSRPLRC
jgi:hypothetical protein